MKLYPLLYKLMKPAKVIKNYVYLDADFKVHNSDELPKGMPLLLLRKRDYLGWIKTAEENSRLVAEHKEKGEKKYYSLTKNKAMNLMAHTIEHNVKALGIPVKFEDNYHKNYPVKNPVDLLSYDMPVKETSTIIEDLAMARLNQTQYETILKGFGQGRSFYSAMLHGLQDYRGGELKTYDEWKEIGATPRKGSAIKSIVYDTSKAQLIVTKKHESDAVYGGDYTPPAPKHPDIWPTKNAIGLLAGNLYQHIHTKTGLEPHFDVTKSEYTTADLKGLMYQYSLKLVQNVYQVKEESFKSLREMHIANSVTNSLADRMGIVRNSKDFSYLEQYLKVIPSYYLQYDLKTIYELSEQLTKELKNVFKLTKEQQVELHRQETEIEGVYIARFGLEGYTILPERLEDLVMKTETEDVYVLNSQQILKLNENIRINDISNMRIRGEGYSILVPEEMMERVNFELMTETFEERKNDNPNLTATEYLSYFGLCSVREELNSQEYRKNQFLNTSGNVASYLDTFAPVFAVNIIAKYLNEIELERPVIIEITKDETNRLHTERPYYSISSLEKDLGITDEGSDLFNQKDSKFVNGTIHMEMENGMMYSREFEYNVSAPFLRLNELLYMEHGNSLELLTAESQIDLKVDNIKTKELPWIAKALESNEMLELMAEEVTPEELEAPGLEKELVLEPDNSS